MIDAIPAWFAAPAAFVLWATWAVLILRDRHRFRRDR